METWTKPSDVDDAPDDDNKVQVWIGKAEREIRRNVEDIQHRLDAEAAETPPRTALLEDAIDVVVAMVSRVFRNPTGARTVSENIGTGPLSESKSVTLGGDTPGSLTLTDSELSKLRGTRARGAFTVSMIPPSSPFYRGLSCSYSPARSLSMLTGSHTSVTPKTRPETRSIRGALP